MGIAIFTASKVFAPVQMLFDWFAPQREPAVFTLRAPLAMAGRALPAQPACRRPAVRVVRVMDTGHAPCVAGRMVIAGRMADVCAELDRMAACEATRH